MIYSFSYKCCVVMIIFNLWLILGCANTIASSSNLLMNNKTIQKQYNHININRNYKNIRKCSYLADTYQVKIGDTLFYIAWITGNDVYQLAQINNIQAPYNLYIGQTLQVQKSTVPISSIIKHSFLNSNSLLDISHINKCNTKIKNISSFKSSRVDKPIIINWLWPTEGKIINKFSKYEGGNKGVDIAGYKGQAIRAAAYGKVVYAGHALRGYGNLIIIKHNNDYLSAYAHNDTILVHEQQIVRAGQKIATMGSSGTTSVRLHFEIRYKGKSVSPLHYLL